jgi:hypothetical protein
VGENDGVNVADLAFVQALAGSQAVSNALEHRRAVIGVIDESLNKMGVLLCTAIHRLEYPIEPSILEEWNKRLNVCRVVDGKQVLNAELAVVSHDFGGIIAETLEQLVERASGKDDVLRELRKVASYEHVQISGISGFELAIRHDAKKNIEDVLARWSSPRRTIGA